MNDLSVLLVPFIHFKQHTAWK